MTQRISSVVTSMQFHLPHWIDLFIQNLPTYLPDVEKQMDLAIELSSLNVRHNTGGPFGAIVVEEESGLIVSLGVNLVVPCNCSGLHGEATALWLAQQQIGSFDLGAPGAPRRKLVTSAAPCVQCLGMIHWSGVWGVAIAATKEDVEESTGFDEGPIHPQWRQELARMGISLEEEVQRNKAVAVLRKYKAEGGYIYQGRGACRPPEGTTEVEIERTPGGFPRRLESFT